jgi:hypothetical protein
VDPVAELPQTATETLDQLLMTLPGSIQAMAVQRAAARAKQILAGGTSAERQEENYLSSVKEGRTVSEALADVSRQLVAETTAYEPEGLVNA